MLSEEDEKEVKRVERLDKNYDKIVGLEKDANGKHNEKKHQTRYMKNAPLVAKRYKTLESKSSPSHYVVCLKWLMRMEFGFDGSIWTSRAHLKVDRG